MHVLREETRRFEMQHHALSEELVCHRGLEPRIADPSQAGLVLLLTRLRLALDRHRLASTKVPAA